jgi:hypothetical protein
MGNLSGVVGYLKKELQRAQQEVQRYTPSSIRRLKPEQASYIVCVGSKTDQLSAKETMGKDSTGIEASSGGWFGSCETHTKNLSGG